MVSCNYTSVINVDEERRDGGYWVLTSNDLAGLLLCGKDLKKLRSDVPAAIRMLFKLNYEMDVQVCPVSEPRDIDKRPSKKHTPYPKSWTAIPSHAACV